MSSNPSPPDPVTALASALSARFGVVACPDVAALLQRTCADPPGLVISNRIRVGGYYDIQPVITVYDAALGTLGFVERVLEPDANWKQIIERAAAVRQILIDRAEETSREGAREFALQVELVLLVSCAASSRSGDTLRSALSGIVRQTGYLRLVGVSILDAEIHPDFPENALRRAFAWLLKDTKKWFERDTFKLKGHTWRDGEHLRLRLTDYRLPGVREFACDPAFWLNLVHGHNGSGKSTVTEALELLLTNRIQRLEEGGEKDYFLVVRHRGPDMRDADLRKTGAAEVALVADDKQVKASVRIGPDGPKREGEQADSSVQANSFRIDQVFMDKLVRSQAAGRAELFLNAFSPGEARRLTELQEDRKKLRAEWTSLPEHVRQRAGTGTGDTTSQSQTSRSLTEEEIAKFIEDELGPLVPSTGAAQSAKDAHPAGVPRTAVEALLPAGYNDLVRLAQLHPPLAESMQTLLNVSDRGAIPQAASQFQSNLSSLLASLALHLSDLRAAQLVFQEFRSWNASGRTTRGEDFEDDLRQWLELQALADLAERYAGIASAVQAAKGYGWVPQTSDAFLLSMQSEIASRKGVLDQLHEARARVEQWQQPRQQETKSGASQSGKIRRWLSAVEVDALNRVGKYLLATTACTDLGVRFNRALAQDRQESFADLAIGREGGLDQAIRETAEIILACERLQQSVAGQGNMGDPLQRITTIVEKARQLSAASKALPQDFFIKLAGDKQERADLLAAFNELLALMTPARWAYRDIEITPDLASGDPALGLTTAEGARADLLFNTAELNAFAVVLFLLLAPRLPNALRVLILDDPLQNMDELTVVTLARALAKLHPPVYPSEWQILAFFHGENSVQVISDETPCRVYHLPWLQSGGGPETVSPSTGIQAGQRPPWQKLTSELIAPVGGSARNRS